MRHRYLFSLALAAVLAGCTAGDQASGPSSTASARDANAQVATGAFASAASTMHSGIASLPDRGELLRYSPPAASGKPTASPAVPVSVSEEHAFAAIHRKELVLDAPDGVRSRIAYTRHQDHGDGNWTWVGRGEDGRSALLTFGQNAVFGSIQRADGSELRIVTQNRRTFAVVVRPDQLRGVETSSGSDALVIPESVSQASARTADAAQTQQVAAAAATAAAANEIDVLLGYSTGLAQRIGSASGAETRMQNLVAISNEGYQSSGITYRIRLVGTVQVAYGDGTRNDSTLHALTGSTGSGSAPVDPAFNALRAARDQTGADLVSFVRQFREPEQDGCGIAWLLGGGLTAIDQSDAPFAYSVVSDGSDVNESDNKNYFCREETLAHELGHSMGQAHNTEDATNTGRHPYSYGFREATNSGFYTIMAYRIPNSNQQPIRHFSNPNVLVGSTATGVANQSDNARSMNETMPIIAQFRASLVAGASTARLDINADGNADLLWYQPARSLLAYWVLNGNTVVRNGEQFSSSGYSVMATGDFNGDRRTDVIWRGTGGDMQMWQGNGTGFDWRPFFQYPAGWEFKGAHDVDADGGSDLIWYQPARGLLAYWIMNGNSIVRHGEQATNGTYTIRQIGDFNGDRRADIIWLGSAGDMQLWQGNGTTFDWRSFYQYPTGWTLVNADDVDGDGRDDLIWHQPARGLLAYWIMNGNIVVRHGEQFSSTQYRVLTTDDFNGDGRTDIIWLGNGGDMQMWQGNGTTFDWRPFYQYPSGGWNAVR
jgi:hypothetical protein